jgi:hypothetical protein
MATIDEMTPDKAVRYACRALTEERTEVGRMRVRWEHNARTNPDGPAHNYFTDQIAAADERLANLDAAMRVLSGLVGR